MSTILCGICGSDLSGIFGIGHTIEVKGGVKIFEEPSGVTVVGKGSEAILICKGRTKIPVHDCERPIDHEKIRISF